MDVAVGSTDVPSSRKSINRLRLRNSWASLAVVCLLFFGIQEAFPIGDQPIHFSGDKQIWNRKTNQVELVGHGAVIQLGETLTADIIHLDLNSRVLDARGNCVYIAQDALIWGEEMHFNIDTHTGTVLNGRVASDKFTLRGEEIHKLGPGRFQTHNGTYTTCRDCGASWALEAKDVDMEVDGYALFSDVVPRIKGAPALWLPYLIMPMKTRRQSGVLFPSFSFSGPNGAVFILPLFWAINRSADMTLGLGEYTQRGHRLEWEGRYTLGNRSQGHANFNFLTDKTLSASPSRWSLDVAQTQELPYSVDVKLRLSEVSDNLYPFNFGNDILGASGEAMMRSSLSFSRGSSEVSAYVAFQRNRNLLNVTPGDSLARQVQFDPTTVQALPTIMVTTNDKKLWGSSFFGGLSVGLTNFTRTAGPFDYDDSSVPFGTLPPTPVPAFNPGVDPIRQATRFSLTPSLYTTFRPFDVISMVPSVQYRGNFYNFTSTIPNLSRGYLLFQTDLSSQIEHIYDFPSNPQYPRIKHLIRPTLTYSFIPFINENLNHPFVQQITPAAGQANRKAGYNFDDYDIVPKTYNQAGANYFTPLGHSLAYGFTTQWIRRKGEEGSLASSYQNIVEFSAGQALDFLALNDPTLPSGAFLTRFNAVFNVNLEKLQSLTTYYYYPILPSGAGSRHTISTAATYILDRSTHQRIMLFDRSFTLGYTFTSLNGATSNLTGIFNFSINDYFMPYGGINYSFLPTGQWFGPTAGLKLQSPSQCWLFTTSMGYAPTTGVTFGFDLSLNLTGSGFGGIMEVTNTVQALSH